VLLKAFEFSLITLGLTLVVAFFVGAIIKIIGAAIRKRENKAVDNEAK
jgi:hypothetical protein